MKMLLKVTKHEHDIIVKVTRLTDGLVSPLGGFWILTNTPININTNRKKYLKLNKILAKLRAKDKGFPSFLN